MTALENIEKTRESCRKLLEDHPTASHVHPQAVLALGMCALAHAILEAKPCITVELGQSLIEQFEKDQQT